MDNKIVQDTSFIGKLLKRTRPVDIDLDLGILYELKDGRRGAIQALAIFSERIMRLSIYLCPVMNAQGILKVRMNMFI